MFQRFPLLWRLGAFVALPFAALVTGAWLHLRNEWPESGTTLTVQGLSAPVAIERDSFGIPTVRATSDHDAFFATGYLHAQDRLWQLEWQRRVAQGRMSEILGAQSLKSDVWMRTLGLQQSARMAWPALSTETQEALQAYADGVNAWLDTHPHLPVEFTALGVHPDKWTPVDSLAWAKVFALYLAGNIDREVQYAVAAPLLNNAERETFFGHLPSSAPSEDLSSRVAMARLMDTPRTFGLTTPNVGSNAWAASGRLTSDHGGLLANDPHLGLQIPSLWYAIAQKGHRLQTTGMGLVGLPMVVFGQNGHIAWGGTNLMADTQDLYLEQLSSENTDLYLADGRWTAFEKRTEHIIVKAPFPAVLHSDLKPVTIEVRGTRHGPVVSDLVGPMKQPMSLRWVALDSGDTSVEALLRVGYARNWDEFNVALQGYVTPALSFVYADSEGNIGQLGAGRIPVRATGVGAYPVPGWDSGHAWTGFIPFDQLPRRYNPPEGYVVSANQDLLAPGFKHFVSRDWAPSSRAERIEARLKASIESSQPFTPAMFRDMQADVVSAPAQALAQVLIDRTKTSDPRQQEALALLRNWDGDMGADSRAGALFNVWVSHLRHRLFSPRLKAAWNDPDQKPVLDAMIDGVSVAQMEQLLRSSANPWCDAGDGERGCHTLLTQSLVDAMDELRRVAGGDPQDWIWGDLHFAVFAHAPFSQYNMLNRVFERRIPTGGSPDTVNVANAELRLGEGYRQSLGASMRQIIGLRPERSTHWLLNAPGQSGQVLSPHYDDQLKSFQGLQFSVRDSSDPRGPITLCLLPASTSQTTGAAGCKLSAGTTP